MKNDLIFNCFQTDKFDITSHSIQFIIIIIIFLLEKQTKMRFYYNIITRNSLDFKQSIQNKQSV